MKRVDVLEKAPSGTVVVPVNVRPILRAVVGAQVQMTACYPDKDRMLRDFFEADCKSRGVGCRLEPRPSWHIGIQLRQRQRQ